jgi:hypothetical protein
MIVRIIPLHQGSTDIDHCLEHAASTSQPMHFICSSSSAARPRAVDLSLRYEGNDDSGAPVFIDMIAAVSESWQCSPTSRRNREKENLTIESREYLLQQNEDHRFELGVPGNRVPAGGEMVRFICSCLEQMDAAQGRRRAPLSYRIAV